MTGNVDDLVGRWTVTFMKWKWLYVFKATGEVTWKDPLNGMTGQGRWKVQGNFVHLSWFNSTTKESWTFPVKTKDSPGWVDATYGKGQLLATKVAESANPQFYKDPDAGMAGAGLTFTGDLWRQDIELGSSATVTLKNAEGCTVELDDHTIAKLVTWWYARDLLYVDIVPQKPGNAELIAKKGGSLATSIQVHVGSNISGAVYVDDWAGSYYSLSHRAVGGNYSKFITLEYKDSVTIDINIDDIADTPSKPNAGEGTLGDGGRRFPPRMDPLSTPRIYSAKQKAIQAMAVAYADFLEVARDGIFFILTINPLVAPVQPAQVRPTPKNKLPQRIQQHYDKPPPAPTRVPVRLTEPYVNLNPGATAAENGLGAWLDQEAQLGRMGLIKRVRGMPESGGPGVRNPDYHLFTSETPNAQLNNINTIEDLTGDAVIANSKNIDNIISNNVGSKSGSQAKVIFIEVGAGESATITDEAIRAWKLEHFSQQFPRLRRVVVIRNAGGARRAVLDLEVR
ncbi:hypothetical protein [Prosthecomicrobium sp. N25]|uniref:hypothetical protein n=1 Tax=Prosthecomicrobium sp. N25 TaxID=3129254 RepID=UPI003077C166